MVRHLALVFVLLIGLGSGTEAAEPAVKTPRIVAHRGLAQHAPENTLAAFRACLDLRIGFEFDVARTSDGQLVCVHDDTVDRTTDGTGKVAEFSLERLRQLDAGSGFDPEFGGERIPTIDEVLALVAEFREQDLLVAVDLKLDGAEEELVRMAERHKVLDRLLFIGRSISDAGVRRRLRAASAAVHAGALANNANEFAAALAAPDADWVYLRYLPSASEMDAVHRAGKRAFLAGSTVQGEQPENWRRAVAAGIDGLLTDFPLELRGTLRAANRTGR